MNLSKKLKLTNIVSSCLSKPKIINNQNKTIIIHIIFESFFQDNFWANFFIKFIQKYDIKNKIRDNQKIYDNK